MVVVEMLEMQRVVVILVVYRKQLFGGLKITKKSHVSVW